MLCHSILYKFEIRHSYELVVFEKELVLRKPFNKYVTSFAFPYISIYLSEGFDINSENNKITVPLLVYSLVCM